MSLDFYLQQMEPTEVFSANITHNLGAMAEAAGIYEVLWRPKETGIEKAHQCIAPLEAGLKLLKAKPKKFKKFDSPNGWGTYDGFVRFVEKCLDGCKENPEATVRASV